MAIDTADKRKSVMNPAFPWRMWPGPDNSIANVEDRAHMAFLYSGVVVSASAATGGARLRTLMGVGT